MYKLELKLAKTDKKRVPQSNRPNSITSDIVTRKEAINLLKGQTFNF